MPSQWLAVDVGTDMRARARKIQRSRESLLAGGTLEAEPPRRPAAELRPAIVDSRRRALATVLDPGDLPPSIEAAPCQTRERRLEHPLGSLGRVLAARLELPAQEPDGVVHVTDPSGLPLRFCRPRAIRDSA